VLGPTSILDNRTLQEAQLGVLAQPQYRILSPAKTYHECPHRCQELSPSLVTSFLVLQMIEWRNHNPSAPNNQTHTIDMKGLVLTRNMPRSPTDMAQSPQSLLPPPSRERRSSRSTISSRRFDFTALWTARSLPKWKAPAQMMGFFLIGLGMSIGHCMFYPLLDGEIVGSPSEQEDRLR
jgi:hypothetical protein